jgi:hypothetical protein
VDGLARRDGGGDEGLLDAVQLVQLALARADEVIEQHPLLLRCMSQQLAHSVGIQPVLSGLLVGVKADRNAAARCCVQLTICDMRGSKFLLCKFISEHYLSLVIPCCNRQN